MAEHVRYIKLNAQNAGFLRSFNKVLRDFKEFRLIDDTEVARPDILVFEIENNPETMLEKVESIIKTEKIGEVLIVSDHMEPNILMGAMRIGVKEFISPSADVTEIQKALNRSLERNREKTVTKYKKPGKIISVLGSKGGVGTTTIAVNLALALCDLQKGENIALIDLNFAFGEIPLFLDISPQFHWGEITKNINRLDDTYLWSVFTDYHNSLKVLPSPAYLNGHRSASPEIMQRILGHLMTMFKYVVIDGGQSQDDSILKAVQMSEHVLMVSILSLPCLNNAHKIIESLTGLGYSEKKNIKFVVNRFTQKSEVQLKDAEKGVGQEVFWQIPNDYKITMAAINQGKPLKVIAPGSGIAKNFSKMAEKILAADADTDVDLGKVKKKSGLLGWFRR
jgi:pilus assembly protein CpaE